MKRFITLGLACIISVMFLASCKKEYTITVQSNNEVWGTVTGSGTYAEGSEVTISAIPAAGFYFVGWNDGINDNPRLITVTEDATYIATFSDNPNGGGGGGESDVVTFSGTIDNNTTLYDLGLDVDYLIDGELFLDGNALLTVEPGVTIMFTGNNGSIRVGENAGLKMVGTASKPIVLCGPTNNPNNGSWLHVEVNSTRSDNQFEYVQFLRGGSGDYDWSSVVRVNGKLSMKHCVIDGSLNSGVACNNSGYFSAFENNVVRNCATYAVMIDNDMAFTTDWSKGNTFTNNANNRMFVNFSGLDVDQALTISNPGIPYELHDGMNLDGSSTLTIQPGVEFLMGHGSNFAIQTSVQFKAQGSASNPIIFDGLESQVGYWDGIEFRSGRSGNEINYCQIKNVGTDDGWSNSSCIYIDGEACLSLNNNVFGPSRYYGVWIEDINNWGQVSHSGNTFNACGRANVHLEYEGSYNGHNYQGDSNLTNLP